MLANQVLPRTFLEALEGEAVSARIAELLEQKPEVANGLSCHDMERAFPRAEIAQRETEP